MFTFCSRFQSSRIPSSAVTSVAAAAVWACWRWPSGPQFNREWGSSGMSTQTKAAPEITRAAERYLEQYGDPLVMNTYLKVTILCLVVVCLALAALVFKSQRALAGIHPMIVRINDVGRAEAIDYRNFQYRPQEAENKYYLTRWAELYFSRNRFTIERDQTGALYFLNSDVQRAVIDQERKDNVIPTYIKDSSLPYVDVEVKEVVLDDLRQSPYSARIEYVKVFTNPADHGELKRERWTATVTYVFRENVKNNELAVNPLGLTIQFTAPDKSLGVANRDLANIESIAPDGRISARLDSNRQVEFNTQDHRHFDHGYA